MGDIAGLPPVIATTVGGIAVTALAPRCGAATKSAIASVAASSTRSMTSAIRPNAVMWPIQRTDHEHDDDDGGGEQDDATVMAVGTRVQPTIPTIQAEQADDSCAEPDLPDDPMEDPRPSFRAMFLLLRESIIPACLGLPRQWPAT